MARKNEDASVEHGGVMSDFSDFQTFRNEISCLY